MAFQALGGRAAVVQIALIMAVRTNGREGVGGPGQLLLEAAPTGGRARFRGGCSFARLFDYCVSR